MGTKKVQERLDELLDAGFLNEVHEALVSISVCTDHEELVAARSDSRVPYYVAGYVARKMLMKIKCEHCSKLLLQKSDSGVIPLKASLIRDVSEGGLIHPSDQIVSPITKIKDAFKHCFSFNYLKTDMVMDMISCLSKNGLNFVGC